MVFILRTGNTFYKTFFIAVICRRKRSQKVPSFNPMSSLWGTPILARYFQDENGKSKWSANWIEMESARSSYDFYWQLFSFFSIWPHACHPGQVQPRPHRRGARPPLFSKGNVLWRGWGRSSRNAEGTGRHNRVMPFLVACSRFPYG